MRGRTGGLPVCQSRSVRSLLQGVALYLLCTGSNQAKCWLSVTAAGSVETSSSAKAKYEYVSVPVLVSTCELKAVIRRP